MVVFLSATLSLIILHIGHVLRSAVARCLSVQPQKTQTHFALVCWLLNANISEDDDKQVEDGSPETAHTG